MRNLTMWQAAAIASEVGLALAASVLAGTFIGVWLDGRFASGIPIFTVVGALVGLVAGVGSMSKLVPYLTRPRKE
jgi:F0F1-type ATP synthase assembly protein I